MSNRDTALMHAIDRDLRDAEKLEHLIAVVNIALDAIAHDVDRLEHPQARWQPGDLVDALDDQLKNMRHELGRVRSPSVVIDEDDYDYAC